jgi:hypothetical protein
MFAKIGWINKIYDVLFPPFCLICGRPGQYICNECELFLIEVGSVPIRSENIDQLIIVWEKNILTDRIFKKVFRKELKQPSQFFVNKALFSLMKNESCRDFWMTWFNPSTEIWSCSPLDLISQNELIVSELISLTDRCQDQVHAGFVEKSAILVSLVFCPDIEAKAKELKEAGFQKIWSLILIG